MKGVYALIIKVANPLHLDVGALGRVDFSSGVYVYVGSARGKSTSLENRLNRHLREEKKIHWHIDYLLRAEVEILDAVFAEVDEPLECRVAKQLAKNPLSQWGPDGFGASDCESGCVSHIIYFPSKQGIRGKVTKAFDELDLNSRFFSEEFHA